MEVLELFAYEGLGGQHDGLPGPRKKEVGVGYQYLRRDEEMEKMHGFIGRFLFHQHIFERGKRTDVGHRGDVAEYAFQPCGLQCVLVYDSYSRKHGKVKSEKLKVKSEK